MVGEVRLLAGQILFSEGSLADSAYILYEGELEIVKNVDGNEIFLDLKSEPGTVIGEMALLEESTRLATVRTRRDSCLLTLNQNQIYELLSLSPGAAKMMLHTLTRRWRGMEALVRHNEKLAQLGTLTAGIAHELNNPVTTVLRGARQLQTAFNLSEQARIALDRLHLSPTQQARVAVLVSQVQQNALRPPILNALTRSDREEEVETWLEEQAIANAWEMAPTFVTLEFTTTQLGELAELFTPDQLPILLRWLEAAGTTQLLLSEIAQGANRVADIVSMMKSYVFLDQAPIQEVDIHQGLDNTLAILHRKLQPDIAIKRDYASHLPKITAYGSELNQLWTNIIDNAADALNGQGSIIIRTHQEDEEVVVEIEDNGPGIPPNSLAKIYDPFFTTKPPGKGTGLGLNISYNIVQKHHGEISVASQPGKTVFQVRLPLSFSPNA
jgi:signal transduction histidine kinase